MPCGILYSIRGRVVKIREKKDEKNITAKNKQRYSCHRKELRTRVTKNCVVNSTNIRVELKSEIEGF